MVPAGASQAVLEFQPPVTPGVSCVSTAPLDCTISSLASGSSAKFILSFQLPSNAAGTISNTFTVSTATPETNLANNSATLTTPITQSADLSIKYGSDPGTVDPDEDLTLAIFTRNNGPSDAASVTVSDTLPPGLTFVSASSDVLTCSTPAVGGSGTITCTAPKLTAGSSATVDLRVHTVPIVGGRIANTATVSSTTPDWSSSDNSSTLLLFETVFDEGVTITATRAPSGSTAAFVITTSAPFGISYTLKDVLPPNTTLAGFTQVSGQPFSCSFPELGQAGTISCQGEQAATFKLVLNSNGLASVTDTVTLPTTFDPDMSNNSATATAIVATNIPALSPLMLVLLALAFTAIGAMILRR